MSISSSLLGNKDSCAGLQGPLSGESAIQRLLAPLLDTGPTYEAVRVQIARARPFFDNVGAVSYSEIRFSFCSPTHFSNHISTKKQGQLSIYEFQKRGLLK